MNENGNKENTMEANDVDSTPCPTEMEQMMARSDAIVSELRRLQFKVTLVMGLLVFILFGVWN